MLHLVQKSQVGQKEASSRKLGPGGWVHLNMGSVLKVGVKVDPRSENGKAVGLPFPGNVALRNPGSGELQAL